jgi:integrase
VTLLALRRYWASHRNPSLIFPAGKNTAERTSPMVPMDRGGLQKLFRVIAKSCGIQKHAHIHTLRHCYGAHLVELRLHLRAVQEEMGHACPKTTALSTQHTETSHRNAQDLINAMVSRLTISLDGKVR